MLKTIRDFLTIPTDKPELAVAQYSAFRRQVPLMYLMLVANTVALSVTHYSYAPWWLTLGAPGVLYLLCAIRMIGWMKGRGKAVTAEMAMARLRSTLLFTVILGIGYTLWALSLYGYGDQLADAHVAFYMAITIVGCIFCLMHLRASAVMLVFFVLVPFVIFFASTGITVFQLIAANIVMVAAALLFILQIYYKDFANLIDSRLEILAREKETERLSQENLRLANLDSLTAISNRRWFFSALEQRLSDAVEQQQKLVVGVMDLDGFKPVNDAYGHAIGDKVLIEVARRLVVAAAAYKMDIARLGGDEFGFIMVAPSTDEAAVAAAQSLIDAISQPMDLPEVSVRVGGSVGVTVFPDHAKDASGLFEHADYALYHAKQTQRGTAVLFTQALATEIAYRSLVEQAMKRAILDEEFQLVFQPLWSTLTQRSYGFEVLARWDSPVLGPVKPDVFIPIAERCGMIGPLTISLFARALEAARDWPSDICLSFNLSIKDVEATQTLDHLLMSLAASGVDPKRIVFELTETAVMQNIGSASDNLRRIRALGIGVALDDFGVGQSNLGQIHRLPITKIKIDRSFIEDLCDSSVSRNIVKTLLDLARNLNCACIVEGVETDEQAMILTALGVTLMQGYLFGRPMAQIAAQERLDRENRENTAA